MKAAKHIIPILIVGLIISFGIGKGISYAKVKKDTSDLCMECHSKMRDLATKARVHQL